MSTPKVHLYGVNGACSMASHILLRESGLDFNKTIYAMEELSKAGGYPEELIKMNPKAKVPVLKVGDEVITEHAAIVTYISQLAPSKSFLGKTPLQTIRAYEWFNYLSSALHGVAYGMFFHPNRFTDVEDGSQDKHVLAKGKQTIQDCYKYIDSKLEGKKWAVGDDFTAVDAYLFVFYRWGANLVGLPMEKDFPNYARLNGEVVKRESVKEVQKFEGLV